MTTDTPTPRRNWHFTRWLIVLIVATLGWSGWRAYTYRAAFRSALSEAKALGWTVAYTDPVATIRRDWRAAYKKETWTDGATHVYIPSDKGFEQHIAVFQRLNPKQMQIGDARRLRDLSFLPPRSRLKSIWLNGCFELTNVDALANFTSLETLVLAGCEELRNVDGLKNLTALQRVVLTIGKRLTNVDALRNLPALRELDLSACTGLTNVDALTNLPSLREVSLNGCKGLTKESVEALKAALPNARISGP